MSPSRSSDGLLRIVVVVIGVLVLFPVLMMVFAVPMMGMMGPMWGGGVADGASPLWGLGLLLAFVLALLGVGYLLYRGLAGGVGGDPAMEELRLAYARGDLTEDEFEERRARLQREE